MMTLGAARLSKTVRQERIISELQASPTLRASELATALGVSHETIRRDLMELDSRGLINRTYGGAARPFAFEAPVRERSKYMVDERERIAAAVCERIAENEVLLMGAGATTNHVARRLAAIRRNITVITHDFSIAQALCHNPTIRTLFLPGRTHPTEGYVYGHQTIAGINGFQANWAIVGATGTDVDGLYDADDEAGAVYRAMVTRAARAILVADSTKFLVPSLVCYAEWQELDHFFTDQAPPPALTKAVRIAGVELIITGNQD
ncbi:DeoR/GlpR family DNA-binding transcription regulator [Ensifer soli]|uniref:DeoR/GlpR family DNA-binding transcription regulator n=1 Tax=Ciceribacter sp. sgz301302 TaxID=3342379 RepID=UPI0035BB5833